MCRASAHTRRKVFSPASGGHRAIHNKHIHSWSKGLSSGGCGWCRAQESRIEGLVAFRMQSARAGFARREKSYHKKMQGYPHFFLFSFFFYSIGSFRERSRVRGARKAKERGMMNKEGERARKRV